MSEKNLTQQDVELYVESIVVQVEEAVPVGLLTIIKKIAGYIGTQGMTIKDACLLADFDGKKFDSLLKKYPIIGKLIQLKELEYKRDLLSTLSMKARSGDDKLSLWLLERRFPDEYGRTDGRKKGEGDGDQNIFEKAIVFIQQHGDSNPLVNPKSKEFKSEKKSLIKKVTDILK